MSLKKYLEDKKIDQIKDDQEFMESEYNAVKTYCENCRYLITNDDLEIIKSRGLEESFTDWKQTYINELYYVQSEDDELTQHIIRKSDGKNIATLDIFSAKVFENEYTKITQTRTCYYRDYELPILQYFFGWYFNKLGA